jgi:hypothetical protein
MQLFTAGSNWLDVKTTNTEQINKAKKRLTIHVYYTHIYTLKEILTHI